MRIETQIRLTTGVWVIARVLGSLVVWVGSKGPLRGFHA